MRLAALALLALLLVPASARAQADSTPIVGGGSFNAAPVLEPGRYRDTLLPSEYLYYGFRVEAGQRLQVRLTLGIENAAVRRLGVIYISGNIHSPNRALGTASPNAGDNPYLGLGEGDNAPLVVTGEEAATEEDDGTDGPWKGPGVYYFALHAVYSGDPPPPRAEIPFTFEAEVQGTAQPVVTAAPTRTPAATATAVVGQRAQEGGGSHAALAAGAGVGGLLVGVIAGIARRQRRR